ncbi:MAG: glycine cleavage system protein GcvH [archaeon GB-1867-097]|nr:glycine cleavage system protein GcvH [Candidatus Culexmicrobium thermophilum]MCS7384593.1 glycine cleavage system protein GcvH [Candidatus Culexmicrobium thermophilum]
MRVDEYEIKEELYYTKDHEWVKIVEEEAIIGITDYAQKELRDIVYVDLPEMGRKVKQGEKLCEVESVKAVSEIYSPVSGEVVEVNERLEDSPELINQDPYGDGWIAKLKPESLEGDVENLMNAEEYAEYIKSLEH